MNENHIHIHIPAGPGTVHISVSDGEVTMTSDGPADQMELIEVVDDMLRRFEAYDPNSGARALHSKLEARGWQAHLPKSRKEGKTSDATYVRYTFAGSKRRATLYMDSAALFAAGKEERKVLESVPNAEDRTSVVRIPHTGGQAELLDALVGVEGVEAWASAD